mmetsp:Transcript_38658/g.86489  ORF Transcript_38658/g.86489 Transcript_38658/m.86489 type:complete len:248 (-) Transcript_38658:11-754(-)
MAGQDEEEASAQQSPRLNLVQPSNSDLQRLVDGENGASSSSQPSKKLLAPLTLRPELALDTSMKRAGYNCVLYAFRLLPFATIYGGTVALVACVILRYRWGFLMSMMLYSIFMFTTGAEIAIWGLWGMVLVWLNVKNDWYAMYLKDVLGEDRSPSRIRRNESQGSPLNGADSPPPERQMPPPTRVWAESPFGDVGWNDLLHIVMIPTYKTPMDCLRMTLHALMNYSLCRTNLAVCFAFEEREPEAKD